MLQKWQGASLEDLHASVLFPSTLSPPCEQTQASLQKDVQQREIILPEASSWWTREALSITRAILKKSSYTNFYHQTYSVDPVDTWTIIKFLLFEVSTFWCVFVNALIYHYTGRTRMGHHIQGTMNRTIFTPRWKQDYVKVKIL